MAYQITFTKRFEKHFKDLNAQEKKQLQNNCSFLLKPPCPVPTDQTHPGDQRKLI